MLLFITHRRLKKGAFEQFRQAWQPEQMPEGIREVAYHARSLEDPDEIISIGLAHDLGRDDLPGLMEQLDESLEAERQGRMAEFVEWTGVDRVFEVIDEVRLES